MGNSYCCNNLDRNQQIVVESDFMYETFIENENHTIKEKAKKNDIISNKSLKHGISFRKTTNSLTHPSIDENDFINPLPEIVVIKFKRH